MDRRERWSNLITAIRALIHSERVDTWTALPGIVQSYNAGAVTAVVQPAVKAQIRVQSGPNSDEKWSDVSLPVIPDVPVCFPGGGGFMSSFPIAAGDEGLLVFCARCIDGWWQLGGVQKQLDLRLHDLSDAVFIPGLFSQVRLPSGGVSSSNFQIKKNDNSVLFEITPAGAMNITAPGGVHLNGALVATGNVTAGSGPNQVDLLNHTHSGVTTGGGVSGPPVPGT